MIEINPAAWSVMLHHARSRYPKECCGLLLGADGEAGRCLVTRAIACRNVFPGEQARRFELDPMEQIEAQRLARALGLEIVGVFHSHPDCDAYFSSEDLAKACPWYFNVVLSIRAGEFSHARAYRVNDAQTESALEELAYPSKELP